MDFIGFIDTQEQWWSPRQFAGFRQWWSMQTLHQIETRCSMRPFCAAQCSHPRGIAAVACIVWFGHCS
jgi:hypothetical protein